MFFPSKFSLAPRSIVVNCSTFIASPWLDPRFLQIDTQLRYRLPFANFSNGFRIRSNVSALWSLPMLGAFSLSSFTIEAGLWILTLAIWSFPIVKSFRSISTHVIWIHFHTNCTKTHRIQAYFDIAPYSLELHFVS